MCVKRSIAKGFVAFCRLIHLNPPEAPVITPSYSLAMWVVIFKNDNIGWAIHSHEWLSSTTTANLDVWLANGDLCAYWELTVKGRTGERWVSHEMVGADCDAIP